VFVEPPERVARTIYFQNIGFVPYDNTASLIFEITLDGENLFEMGNSGVKVLHYLVNFG
jgi:hypothetical protein